MSGTSVAWKVICAMTMGYSKCCVKQLSPSLNHKLPVQNSLLMFTIPPQLLILLQWNEQRSTMRVAGYSNDEIWATLTGHHEISDWQISCTMKRYGGKENYNEVGHSTGCPCKLTPHDIWIACWHLSNQTAHETSDLQHKYFLEVSVETIKWALQWEGLEAYIWCTVPFIEVLSVPP